MHFFFVYQMFRMKWQNVEGFSYEKWKSCHNVMKIDEIHSNVSSIRHPQPLPILAAAGRPVRHNRDVNLICN